MHTSQNSGIPSQLFLSVGKQQSKNIQFFVLSLGILADRTGDAEGSEGPAKDILCIEEKKKHTVIFNFRSRSCNNS